MDIKNIEDIVSKVIDIAASELYDADADHRNVAYFEEKVANYLHNALIQHHQKELEKAVGLERWNIGAWIEQQDFARKEGERSGDPASVWAIQTVIKQINQYLQTPTKTDN